MPPFPCSDWEESENTRSGKGRPRRMPELPEVEVARRAIEEHCVGKRIVQCSVADDPKVIDGVTPSDLESALVGKTIVAALRKGKNLWLRLDSPPFPTFQFGMAGAIYIKGVTLTKYKRSAVSDADEWPSTYSKVLLKLDDGLELSFTDKRRFARPKSVAPISELGPDALLGLMPIDAFMASLSKKKIAIKALLLDQSYISGIGNWIADEVLYQVIEKALEVGADSSQFSQDWIFHSREKKPGNAFVAGKKIEFITVGGRTSAYVPELQKLTANQLEEASYKKSAKTRSIKNVDKEESTSEKEESNKISKKTKDPKRQAKKTGETKNTSSSGKGKTQKQDESALGSLKKRKESNQAETRQKKAKKRKNMPTWFPNWALSTFQLTHVASVLTARISRSNPVIKHAQRQGGTRRRGDCIRRMWLLLHKADPRTGCRDCWGADGAEQFLCFDCLGWRALEVAQHNAHIKVTHSAMSTHQQGNVERDASVSEEDISAHLINQIQISVSLCQVEGGDCTATISEEAGEVEGQVEGMAMARRKGSLLGRGVRNAKSKLKPADYTTQNIRKLVSTMILTDGALGE
ncbi:hypothetical protein ZIOFF_000970 [Zingiber officinale]|uniref:Formamidopyrimidine-DNA glycosylase catalytic domain-containing protein n=1 Tax=Zingiber officinale TaxID=94328 RepID=A0A8J5IIP0_ZINOF|nr:hypothetical protein ZIOFF_000970 [Zingiber officinale]